mmetsp:Transcript_80957/g.188073  ORF Transcript_80957/g.188073 Transcript_80957/m.188073 type:complete len:1097 (+) Transcript_80957:66-3356(+)
MLRCPAAPWALVACGLTFTVAYAAEDINPEGPCKAALDRLCAHVEPGPGAKAMCLREQQSAARERKEAPLPSTCMIHLHSFFVNATRHGDMTFTVAGLRTACSSDIARHCPDKSGKELKSCLKSARRRNELSRRCKEKVFAGLRHESQHIELDGDVFTACQDDLESIPACKGLPKLAKPGEKKACLLENRRSASSKCRDALFHRMQHDLTDVRLNQVLFTRCRTEIREYCGSLELGEGRTLKCLWDKRNSDDFKEDCKDKVQEITRYKVQDYRLDSKISSKCQTDIEELCKKEQSQVDHLRADELFGDDWQEGKSGVVIQCLKANFSKIHDRSCQNQIRLVTRVHAEAAVADPTFARHCRDPVNRFCNKTQPERLHLCLRAHFSDLGPNCKRIEIIQGSLASMDISMKPLMQTACKRDIPKFCEGVAQGDAQVIQCLQDHMEDEQMSSKCSEIVGKDLEASNHDWRLKWGIHHNCMVDASMLCEHAVPKAAGAVLSCLKANRSAITSAACRTEMFRFIRQGVSNIRFALGTYSACVGDVQRFCSKVHPGQGRVHDCLLGNRTLLSQACAKTEFQTQQMVAQDMRLSSFWSVCLKSFKKFCPNVQPGNNRIWNCLVKERNNPEVDPTCRKHLKSHVYIQNNEFYMNPNMVEHCQEDAKRLCSYEEVAAAKKDFSSEGALIGCLVRERSNVRGEDCKADLREKALQRLANIEYDPQAFWGCKEDIQKFCQAEQKLNQGQGSVHSCLQKHFDDLGYTCRLAEFEYMTLQTEDARMNLFVNRECKAAQKRFCDDTVPGKGQRIVCMLRHLHDSSMEADCRKKLVKLQRIRSSSLIFNPQLAANCKEDLKRIQKKHGNDPMCAEQQDQSLVLYGAGLACLVTYHNESRGVSCQASMKTTLFHESNDLRALPSVLYNFCKDDIAKLCQGVEPGMGRWHKCMRKNKEQIKDKTCKITIIRVQENEKKDVLLNPAVRTSCSNEIKTWCRNVARGQSRMFVCLKQHGKEVGFSGACTQALDEIGVNATIAAAAQDSTSVLKSLLDYKSFWDKWGLALIGGITILLVLWIVGIVAVIRRLRKGKGLYGVQIDQPAEVVGAEQEDKP